MIRTDNLKVLIAGGGIGGLTTLLALRARGIDAQLFEQAEAFRQVGAGIQISSNATRILRSLGLGEALARACVYPEGRDYRAWDDGDRLYYTPLGARAEAQFGAPYYHAHRADLLDVLLGGVANTGFRLNARIEGFAQTADQVTVTLADGTEVTGDVLIGADGIHSTVRGQLFGKELPRYTGNVAWRGLVPAERVAHLDLGRVTGVWMGPNRSIVQYYVAAARPSTGSASAAQSSRRANPGSPKGGSRMRSPNIRAGTRPFAPLSPRPRACCGRRCTTASRCRTGGSGASCCWAMPRIR